jgi:fibronectin-binding autotransporter adhesin
MADRYWVGGAGTWDATTTTNWATSTGGAGGASAPTSSDNVIFDSLSNATDYTVTISTNAVCKDWTVAGPLVGNVTFAGTSNIGIYGSLTWPVSGMTRTYSGISQFLATTTGHTITTNGVSFGARVEFDGVGGGWTLGSALTTTSASALAVNILNGTFDTGNYNVTCSSGGFTIGAGTKTVNLGSSTISTNIPSGGLTAVSTGTTLNAGTSLFSLGASSPTFAGGGLTFYNVSFTSTSAGSVSISGVNTFNDLTFTSRSATGLRIVALFANQTVSGTLTLGAANTAIRRILVASDTIGTQRTITLNGTLAALADVDFRDIGAAGTVATPWTGTRLGNVLGNANITFDAGKNCFRVGTGNWTATQWSLTSGGSLDVNNFPLAQDTMVFDTNTVTGTHTIDASGWQLGSLNCSALNVAVTIASGSISPTFIGNITLDSDVTLTGTGTFDLRGQGTTQTITSAGVTFTQLITINSPSGTVQFLDNTTTTNSVILTNGTLDLNDFDLTCNVFSSNNTNTRSIDFGTGNISITGNNLTFVCNIQNATNLSILGTPVINLTYSGAVGSRGVGFGGLGGSTELNVINFNVLAGTDTISFSGAFKTINFTGFAGTLINSARTIYGNLIISTGMTLTAGAGATNFRATSGTQQITTNGQTLDFPITQDGVGGTVQLQDNLTMGSTRTFTLTEGTLDIDGKTLTAGSISSSNSNTRSIDFGTNGVIDSAGAWTATTSTGLTTAGRGRIKMSSASAKTFAGGGANYSAAALEQAGAGTLTITGANTFDDITNSNATASQITFPASTTTSVRKLSVSGSSGNLVSLRSSTEGTAFTIQTV